MTNATDSALELRNVVQRFGATTALSDVSLSVAPGEFIALLGPSGCGKTTMLQIIAGFLKPTGGEVVLGGRHVENVPANRRRIGMVFQNYALFPHMSVRDNVAYGLRARGTGRDVTDSKVREMLRLVQMESFSGRMPGQLSGGQQQRVALARALAIEPSIVLLDEPFSALDKNLRLDMQIEIKALLSGYGVTTIMVTHDQEEALSMADRIVVMSRGRVEQIDTPEALYDSPKSLFVNDFIGHANQLKAVVVNARTARLADGTLLDLGTERAFPAGEPVIVTVRPENLAIGSEPVLPGRSLAATARVTLPLGPSEVIEALTASGEALKIHRPRAASAQPIHSGTPLVLSITEPATLGVFKAPPA